jgi:4-amino-4-deoxy-L-arabinose transferase-like glycosyltransferase
VIDSLTGAALAVVTWLLAREGLSRGRARIAGLIVALHPGMILYAALVMTEPLAALLTLLAFWIAVRDAKPIRGVMLGAIVLGVAALVRPQALLCVPFLACSSLRSRACWCRPSRASRGLAGALRSFLSAQSPSCLSSRGRRETAA